MLFGRIKVNATFLRIVLNLTKPIVLTYFRSLVIKVFKSALNDFISEDVDGLQMMNLLDSDIPLEYLIPIDVPYADSYE